jgi:hypothetical protein
MAQAAIREAAQAAAISLRRSAERLAARLRDRWPQSVLDAAGAAPDFPGIGEIRNAYGPDSARKTL